MKNLIWIFLLLFGIACMQNKDQSLSVSQGGNEPFDSSLIIKCADYGDEYFKTVVYGERSFSGFGSAILNGEKIFFFPEIYIYAPDSLRMQIQLFNIDTLSTTLKSRLSYSIFPFAIGKYSNEILSLPLINADTNLLRSLYSTTNDDGCSPASFYRPLDTIPHYTYIEITDIDKERRIICGSFRMRGDSSYMQPGVQLPPVVRIERGTFCTKY